MDINPLEDGVTHINVYSKGKSELGQLCSNLAYSPFEHPEYGHFDSIEGFWYWLSLGKRFDEFRTLFGFQCKQLGTSMKAALKQQRIERPVVEDFEAQIKKAILLKFEQNQKLSSLLKDIDLPLTHYYVYGSVLEGPSKYKLVFPTQFNWVIEYIDLIRQYLNGKAHKLLIAGSRDICDYEYLKKVYLESDIKVVEFVSGGARGVDQLCIDLARELKMPCKVFLADWDRYKRAAGHIRNEEMAKYATSGITIWDGVSPGTKNMISRIEYHKLPHQSFLYK